MPASANARFFRLRLIAVLAVLGLVVLPFAHSAGALDVGLSSKPPSVTTEPLRDAPNLRVPPPTWYTEALHNQVLASGHKGIEVPLKPKPKQTTELNCLGYSPPSASAEGTSATAVSAGGCMVFPSGCTMNFIFRDPNGANYIGTAGHCAKTGSTVVMQVGTRIDPTNSVPLVTLAAIGKVTQSVDGGIGRDFALVKIDPGWSVVPGVAGAAGPIGTFCGDPVGQPVAHYGHGYVFAVGPGNAKAGEVIPDLSLIFRGSWESGYNWAGYGLPGDSGSPVMDAAGLAVGNLTHGLGIDFVPIPGISFGTTLAGIFGIIGSSYSLVTVHGRTVGCEAGTLIGLEVF